MFEYDPEKNASNLLKHGIDFESAHEIWTDDRHLIIPARTLDEPRFLIIGLIDKRHWSAIYTYRDSVIRIISARRSRKEEIKLYETT